MKGSESGRVLRSGRRLLPEESVEVKIKRENEGDDDWPIPPPPLKNKAAVPRKAPVVPKTEAEEERAVKPVKRSRFGDGVDRMYGIAYTRKRRRTAGATSLKLFSKKREESGEISMFSVVVKPCAAKSGRFSSLLVSILRYMMMTRFTVTLPEVFTFFLSKPSQGVQFLQGSPPSITGICRFFEITQFTPLFSVDFSAVPVYFEYLHSSLLLDFLFRSFFIVQNPINAHSDNKDHEEEIGFLKYKEELQILFDTVEREPSASGTVIPDVIQISGSLSLPTSAKGTGQPRSRNGQFRSVLNSRCVQKRRSSLKKRKARSPITMTLCRSNGSVASDLAGGRKCNIQFSGMTSTKRHRSFVNENTAGSLKDASSAKLGSAQSVDSSFCFANILVIESDRCYREDGAVVTLEMPDSTEWLLIVKRDGLERCTCKAEQGMPSWSFNRFTHALMFSLGNGWKLEFANRQDWNLFTDLYKQCFDRNIHGPVAIPVPGVHGVSSYAESNNNFIFQRPATYISEHGDEITRAMTRKTANYDMDSEDEEWLSKLNNVSQEHVSEDNFELIIDALEKVYYCNPDDSFDVKSAVSSRQDLGGMEVIEAVYTYWMRKRKQKHSLIRVFEIHQSKRASLIPKHFLRKKRSVKRQPSQFGRGSQPNLLRAMVAEQDALAVDRMRKAEEARTSAKKSTETAIEKRKEAQFLAKNADLATYRALMMLRVAEALAIAGESGEVVAKDLLGIDG